MPMNCLIVEDEPLAQQLLQRYIDQIPELLLVATCYNAIEAFQILHSQKIHLIFLDIRMQGIDGVTFLESLKHPPALIFTTAYAEYAVKSYELNAVDYLLKPVTYERFATSVQKVLKAHMPEEAEAPIDHIYVKVKYELVKIN